MDRKASESRKIEESSWDPKGSLHQFTQKGQKKMKSGIKPSEEWSRFSLPSNASSCSLPMSARDCVPAPENSRKEDKASEAPGSGSQCGQSLHMTCEGLVPVCGMLGRSEVMPLFTWRHGGTCLLSWRQAHRSAFWESGHCCCPWRCPFPPLMATYLLGQQTPHLGLVSFMFYGAKKTEPGSCFKRDISYPGNSSNF